MASNMKAIEEYRLSPVIATLTRLCVLDKLIVIAVCRHMASSGTLGMTLEEIMNRLEDLMKEMQVDPKICIIPAPMSTVCERMQTMFQSGIIGKQEDKLHRSAGFKIARYSVLMSRVHIRDVCSAFKDTPFEAYLPGTNSMVA